MTAQPCRNRWKIYLNVDFATYAMEICIEKKQSTSPIGWCLHPHCNHLDRMKGRLHRRDWWVLFTAYSAQIIYGICCGQQQVEDKCR